MCSERGTVRKHILAARKWKCCKSDKAGGPGERLGDLLEEVAFEQGPARGGGSLPLTLMLQFQAEGTAKVLGRIAFVLQEKQGGQ